MKVSYNWLKSYLPFESKAEELEEILTSTGLEVESLEKVEAVPGGLQGVVVGEVMTCEQHPDADRLKVTMVDVGAGELLQIVCGAPNVAAGQKVIVATEGTTLYPKPDQPFKIKKSKIRGVESNGMLCAEDELGIGTSHDGILVLDKQLPVGKPMAEVLELEDDYTIEIGLTPNRADAMGHVGVARDLKAYLNFHNSANLTINLPSVTDYSTTQSTESVKISVEAPELCPKYAGITLVGVEVKPSPAWLQKKLRAIGLSPINNVVDVTNFVMLELGTPLHAFDGRVVNGQVIVRTAKPNETLKTLDGIERKLLPTDLVIANQSEPMCIAGVFGGEKSGVSESTTTVFLESAYFDPVSVRKTAKAHTLSTDASFRFERGVNPELTEYALKRAADLIIQVAGGKAGMAPAVVGAGINTYREVAFSPERCRTLIGAPVSDEEILAIFKELDIAVLDQQDQWIVRVPSYRVDVTREPDLIEEVLRIYGFNRVGLPEKLNTSIVLFPRPNPEEVRKNTAEFLVGKGFIEIMNNSLTSGGYAAKLGGDVISESHQVEILNPLSNELNVMRQSLIFQALETVAYNQNRQNPNLRLMEFGSTYNKFQETYVENKRLILVVTGKQSEENWANENHLHSFYSLKGYATSVLQRLGLDGFLKETALKKSVLAEGIQWNVLKNKVAELGVVSPAYLNYFGIKQPVFVADFDWDALLESLKLVKIKYAELPKTFAVRRDFSLLLDDQVSFQQVEQVAKSCEKQLLKEVGLFDVYEGKNLPSGKKSYAVSFTFQDAEKTLKDEQIDPIMDRIQKELANQLGATLR